MATPCPRYAAAMHEASHDPSVHASSMHGSFVHDAAAEPHAKRDAGGALVAILRGLPELVPLPLLADAHLRFVADPRFTRRPTNSPGPQSAARATWPRCSNRSGCWTSLTASSTKRRSERSTPVLSLGPRQWGVGVGAHEAGRKITQLFNSAISKLGFWTNGPLRVLATKRGFV